LVIRIHPAEIRLELARTRSMLAEFLQTVSLPTNVVVVPPESDVSSYALARMSVAGLVYTSTMGLEMAAMDIPVIVAGRVHYAGKGFTLEIPRRAAYRDLIGTVVNEGCAQADRVERALQYAYFFFFKVMTPFSLVDSWEPSNVWVDPEFAEKLRPDADPSLDRICDALLSAPTELRVPMADE
jgi:hypothetical protein